MVFIYSQQNRIQCSALRNEKDFEELRIVNFSWFWRVTLLSIESKLIENSLAESENSNVKGNSQKSCGHIVASISTHIWQEQWILISSWYVCTEEPHFYRYSNINDMWRLWRHWNTRPHSNMTEYDLLFSYIMIGWWELSQTLENEVPHW